VTPDGNDETRLSGGAATTTDAGWLSSSGSIDHGRFAPGAILESRYRVLGLLGRGGMGEVYRADDLRLGQQVALKFLPAVLSRDPVRLAQFHNEVRTARQVSHPNVCRVYDIGEIEGQLFITMEYVDGEDLSGLLRRIGRLPEDKGLDIARQICAGLAAAHERGVLHRDLKPANIMLDGAGKVRVMDFSLAAAGEVTDVRAGTPAYMAPEQLGGQEVTVRSDIYALGLVLYEIFTGRRAFDAKTLSALIEQHQSGPLTSPTTIVKALDPAIEAAIVRCLDPNPTRRPASAIAVSAALPGGDPLAAALAAGETPSPEMVAAAGGDMATMSVVKGTLWMSAATVLVLAFVVVSARTALIGRVPLTKGPAVLSDRADELRQSFGYTDPPKDHTGAFMYSTDYLNWAEQHGSGATRWAELPLGRPPVVLFWYRTAPQLLIPTNPVSSVTSDDPPVAIDGMTSVTVDTKGRLVRFEAAPPQIEHPANAPPPRTDWSKLFAAAGVDIAGFAETAPSRTPPTFADERRAWRGIYPDSKIDIRIEAAGYRGRPVMFVIVAPWTGATREPSAPPARNGTNPIVVYFLLILAGAVAYWNVRRGRGDQRGAFRVAAFMAILVSGIWLMSPHVSDVAEEQSRFFVHLGVALFLGGAMYLLYLGLEPFVRRAWPDMLVGWTRVLSGRIRDPLVGRDVLIGVTWGAALALLNMATSVLPPLLRWPEPQPNLNEFGPLFGLRGTVLTLLGAVNNGMQGMLITTFEFAGFRGLFEMATRAALKQISARRGRPIVVSDKRLEVIFIILAFAFMGILTVLGNGNPNKRFLDALAQAVSITVILHVLLRIGIFSSAVMFVTNAVLLRMPFSFDSSALYASQGWFAIVLLLGLAAIGYWMAANPRREVWRST
jgi:serine/threonine-protein kinase